MGSYSDRGCDYLYAEVMIDLIDVFGLLEVGLNGQDETVVHQKVNCDVQKSGYFGGKCLVESVVLRGERLVHEE